MQSISTDTKRFLIDSICKTLPKLNIEQLTELAYTATRKASSNQNLFKSKEWTKEDIQKRIKEIEAFLNPQKHRYLMFETMFTKELTELKTLKKIIGE